MKISYKSNKLKNQCENPALAQKVFGKEISTKLTRRIMELEAAENLDDIQRIPATRLHRLKGKRRNQFAVDLVGPYRLVFSPMDCDVDLSNLRNIKIVLIEEVVDYHGK